MATYNGEKFIREQLDSIVNQTHENLEIIIQDDGSTDATPDIIREYSIKDPRIEFFQNQENLGIIQNFRDLIKKSTGTYLALSDQDDIWKLNKIEVLLNHINGQSLIYTDSSLIDESGNSTGETLLNKLKRKPNHGKMLLNLLESNTISGHASLFESSLGSTSIDLLDETRPADEFMYDQIIGVAASLTGGVSYYEEPLTYHRQHANNNFNQIQRTSKRREELELKKRLASFFQRKKRRVHTKITKASERLSKAKEILDHIVPVGKNPLRETTDVIKVFNRSFFNRKLYQRLIESGIKKEDAKRFSRGRYYYITMGIF